MGAPDLLRHLRGAGFTLALADGGIRVAPSTQLTDDLRQAIRDHRAELMTLLQRADTAALIGAINECCRIRGDDDANRAGLIAECSALDAAGQVDMIEHFQQQAAIWQRAARGGRP